MPTDAASVADTSADKTEPESILAALRAQIATCSDAELNDFLSSHGLGLVVQFLVDQLSDEGKKKIFEIFKARFPTLWP